MKSPDLSARSDHCCFYVDSSVTCIQPETDLPCHPEARANTVLDKHRSLRGWQATAFNQAPHSSNRIHSDEVARAYGFKGGLVPGVTVSSYLIHPAVVAWGEAWLDRGHASITVENPLYDGEIFNVITQPGAEHDHSVQLLGASGQPRAHGSLRLPDSPPEPPTRRGDPLLKAEVQPPVATRDAMQALQEKGMCALPVTWQHSNHMATYLRDDAGMPDLHRHNSGGLANAAFMLSLTNWVLAGNVYMNPWIHLQTESQNYALVESGTALVVECDIRDLFNKKGHEFVDLNVDVYREHSGEPVMTALLRAIYKLRPPGADEHAG